jgi:hypothetical protein
LTTLGVQKKKMGHLGLNKKEIRHCYDFYKKDHFVWVKPIFERD